MKKIIFLVAIVFALLACNDNRIFDEVRKFPSDEWKVNDSVKFLVNVADTLTAYDISIHIRNDRRYAYSNLWMFIETSSPAGAVLRDTVEFVLADDNGQWLGQGLYSINSMLMPYKTNVRFPYRGIYTFTLQQAMRKESIYGIKDIGLQVEIHQ
jgi:gliding motility-associated lipoprotein GldH